MDATRPIESVADLWAHALAIEREAAARYQEFAQQMYDHENVDAARLFERLAAVERRHTREVEQLAAGIALPALEPGQYAWLDKGSAQAAAHELIFRLMTPRDALQVALKGEERAKAFFDHVAATTDDPAIRALAHEMLADEDEHMAWLMTAIDRAPASRVDWNKFFDSVPARAPVAQRARTKAIRRKSARQRQAGRSKLSSPGKAAGARLRTKGTAAKKRRKLRAKPRAPGARRPRNSAMAAGRSRLRLPT